jgi:hypothetical protein
VQPILRFLLYSQKHLKKQIPALYSQENAKDPPVVCKFFDPVGSWTWYAIEGSPVDEDGYFDTDKAKVDPVIAKILAHLGLPARAPPRSPARLSDRLRIA